MFTRIIIGVCALAAAPLGAAPTKAPAADVHGVWVLNNELSDRTPTPGNPGAGPGRMAPPGASDPEQMKKVGALMDELMEPPERLTIVQADHDAVTIVDGDGHSRTYSTSGKKEEHQLQSGTVETRTRWDGAALRQEITVGGGPKLIETFTNDPERRQLIVAVQMHAGLRKGPSIRRVYDTVAR